MRTLCDAVARASPLALAYTLTLWLATHKHTTEEEQIAVQHNLGSTHSSQATCRSSAWSAEAQVLMLTNGGTANRLMSPAVQSYTVGSHNAGSRKFKRRKLNGPCGSVDNLDMPDMHHCCQVWNMDKSLDGHDLVHLTVRLEHKSA